MKDLSPAEYRALAEFRCQIRKFIYFSEEQARACGLEPQQHQLLLALKGLPQGTLPTIGELAARLHVKHHSAVELVNRLAARGAVARVPSINDRRQVLVTLTRSGAALLRKLSISHRSELENTGPELARALKTVMRPQRPRHIEAAV